MLVSMQSENIKLSDLVISLKRKQGDLRQEYNQLIQRNRQMKTDLNYILNLGPERLKP